MCVFCKKPVYSNVYRAVRGLKGCQLLKDAKPVLLSLLLPLPLPAFSSPLPLSFLLFFTWPSCHHLTAGETLGHLHLL